MTNTSNETGNTYGRLTVIGEAPKRGHERWWTVRCECGTVKEVRGVRLRNGNTVSCGCKRAEGQVKHGGTRGVKNDASLHHPLYRTWMGIKQRTVGGNPNTKIWKHYGGRGISMDAAWRDDFAVFRDWILANLGERPEKHTLDRIDVNGHYVPGNLRWATAQQQKENQRATLETLAKLQREYDDLAAWVMRGHE